MYMRHTIHVFTCYACFTFGPRLMAPRNQLRLGLSTSTSSLFLGETEEDASVSGRCDVPS